MIIEMDKLVSEDHIYKASKEEIEFYRGNASAEASRGQKEARNIGTDLLILVFLALAYKLVGV